MKPDRVQLIVTACCALHNYLMENATDSYCPNGFADSYDEDNQLLEGSWRSNLADSSLFNNSIGVACNGRPTEHAKVIRDKLRDYVNSEQGSLHWQSLQILGKG